MGKSLTDTAKAVLMRESNDPAPDRDAQSKTSNATTLAPNGGTMGPGAEPTKTLAAGQVQDLGPALVNNTDIQPSNSQKVTATMSKDTSKSSVSQVPPEPMAQLEEDEELEEDYEVPEELREFIETLAEEGFSEEEIAEAIEENFELVEEPITEEEEGGEEAPANSEESAENEAGYETAPVQEAPVDMTEHVKAIFEGEDLSEDFKTKAKTIVEAAVNSKIKERAEALNEQFEEAVVAQVEQIKEQMAEAVDAYLNYVIEEWVKENEVAVESSLRSELTEDIVLGLKKLFEENYIDIPEEKVNVVEELSAKVDELSGKLDEEIEKAVELKKQLAESQKVNALNTVVEGLTTTQAEKIKQLAESVDFVSERDFTTKLVTLRESYFPKTKTTTHKELDVIEPGTEGNSLIQEEVKGPMSKYVRALGTKLPN